MTAVRYLVRDVDQSVAFYTKHLGFAVKQQFGPNMAIVTRDDLTLWLAGPGASAARPMPDGRKPEPGGWNRFVLPVDDVAALVAKLKQQGREFPQRHRQGTGRSADPVRRPFGQRDRVVPGGLKCAWRTGNYLLFNPRCHGGESRHPWSQVRVYGFRRSPVRRCHSRRFPENIPFISSHSIGTCEATICPAGSPRSLRAPASSPALIGG